MADSTPIRRTITETSDVETLASPVRLNDSIDQPVEEQNGGPEQPQMFSAKFLDVLSGRLFEKTSHYLRLYKDDESNGKQNFRREFGPVLVALCAFPVDMPVPTDEMLVNYAQLKRQLDAIALPKRDVMMKTPKLRFAQHATFLETLLFANMKEMLFDRSTMSFIFVTLNLFTICRFSLSRETTTRLVGHLIDKILHFTIDEGEYSVDLEYLNFLTRKLFNCFWNRLRDTKSHTRLIVSIKILKWVDMEYFRSSILPTCDIKWLYLKSVDEEEVERFYHLKKMDDHVSGNLVQIMNLFLKHSNERVIEWMKQRKFREKIIRLYLNGTDCPVLAVTALNLFTTAQKIEMTFNIEHKENDSILQYIFAKCLDSAVGAAQYFIYKHIKEQNSESSPLSQTPTCSEFVMKIVTFIKKTNARNLRLEYIVDAFINCKLNTFFNDWVFIATFMESREFEKNMNIILQIVHHSTRMSTSYYKLKHRFTLKKNYAEDIDRQYNEERITKYLLPKALHLFKSEENKENIISLLGIMQHCDVETSWDAFNDVLNKLKDEDDLEIVKGCISILKKFPDNERNEIMIAFIEEAATLFNQGIEFMDKDTEVLLIKRIQLCFSILEIISIEQEHTMRLLQMGTDILTKADIYQQKLSENTFGLVIEITVQETIRLIKSDAHNVSQCTALIGSLFEMGQTYEQFTSIVIKKLCFAISAFICLTWDLEDGELKEMIISNLKDSSSAKLQGVLNVFNNYVFVKNQNDESNESDDLPNRQKLLELYLNIYATGIFGYDFIVNCFQQLLPFFDDYYMQIENHMFQWHQLKSPENESRKLTDNGFFDLIFGLECKFFYDAVYLCIQHNMDNINKVSDWETFTLLCEKIVGSFPRKFDSNGLCTFHELIIQQCKVNLNKYDSGDSHKHIIFEPLAFLQKTFSKFLTPPSRAAVLKFLATTLPKPQNIPKNQLKKWRTYLFYVKFLEEHGKRRE